MSTGATDDGADATVPVDSSTSMKLETKKPDTLGHEIGRYVVIDRIGAGGMGEVVRAYDPKLRRELALKRVHQAMLGPEGEARLIREAQAMAQLSHPNVVGVYDVDVEDGVVVVAMEYVRGDTLKSWLRRDRTWPEILDAFAQAGQGLAAAHGAGMVHRDFKPSNVLVGETGLVKVTDFGLAKAVGTPSEDTGGSTGSDVELTAAGEVMGTPRYMAPEQLRGADLDARVDQYAFCVALWVALTGEPPFCGPDMPKAKLRGPPPWPKGISVPHRISTAIVRGLAPDPGDRFGSMDALLEAISFDPSRRRRWIVAGTVVVAAGAIAIAAWPEQREPLCMGAREQLEGVWDDERREQIENAVTGTQLAYADKTWGRLQPALDDYAEDWASQHQEACEATAVRGEQSAELLDLRMVCLAQAKTDLLAAVDVFAEADAQIVEKALDIVGALPRLSKCEDVEALRAEVPEPSDPEVVAKLEVARARLAKGRTLRRAGKYAKAHELLAKLNAEAQSLGHDPHRAEVAWEFGRTLDKQGRYDDALPVVNEALTIALRHGPALVAAGAASTLTRVLGDRLSRAQEGRLMGEVALALADKVGDPLVRGLAHNHYGSALEASGEWERAEVEYRRALEIREAALGPEHPITAMSHNAIGNALQQQGKFTEAEAQYRLALKILESTLGADHPHLTLSHNNLGAAFARQGKLAEGEAEYRLSLEIQERSVGSGHPNYPVTRSNLGALLSAQGQHEEALDQYRIALKLMEASHSPDHPDLARAHNNLGVAYHVQQRYPEAAIEYAEAIEIWRKALGPDHPSLGTIHHNLGAVKQELGDLSMAKTHLERAWEMREHATLAASDRGGTAFALAGVLWEIGEERERAVRLGRVAVEDYRKAGQGHAATLANVEAWLADR